MKARTLVRIPCRSHRDAKELALRLQADGYRVTRRWKLVVARTDAPEDAAYLTRGSISRSFRRDASESGRPVATTL